MSLPPCKLAVEYPTERDPFAGEAWDYPGGYSAPKIGTHAFPDVMWGGTPRDVARILLADGRPAHDSFTITSDSGVLMFCGNIGAAAT